MPGTNPRLHSPDIICAARWLKAQPIAQPSAAHRVPIGSHLRDFEVLRRIAQTSKSSMSPKSTRTRDTTGHLAGRAEPYPPPAPRIIIGHEASLEYRHREPMIFTTPETTSLTYLGLFFILKF